MPKQDLYSFKYSNPQLEGDDVKMITDFLNRVISQIDGSGADRPPVCLNLDSSETSDPAGKSLNININIKFPTK